VAPPSPSPVTWLRQHPFVADILLITPVVVMAVIGIVLNPPGSMGARPFDVLGVLLVAGIVVPLAWRRRAPRLVLAVNLGCTVPLLLLDYSDSVAGVASLLALYTVASACERRPAFIALGLAALVMVPVLVYGSITNPEHEPFTVLFSNMVIFGTAWLIGDAVRNRRMMLAALRFRAESAERQRDEEARRAVLDERARIAREMHDIVAHSMSVMIVQAGAARRVLDKDPVRAAGALAEIEHTGREAMVEMRRLLGVLRADTGAPVPDLTPQPGLAAVPAMIEQWRAAGLDVDYDITGPPPSLAAGIDVSAYRLVQEALTNVSRHAGPAHVTVAVHTDDDVLDLRVTDDGYGAAADGPADEHPGHGLIGMRERVALFGGTVTAGPRAGGGFEVHASLPLDGVRSSEP
jgi:signal transduction histidine kinase